MNYPRLHSEKESKVTHVATPPAPCEGMGRPFPLDPKPGAERHRFLE